MLGRGTASFYIVSLSPRCVYTALVHASVLSTTSRHHLLLRRLQKGVVYTHFPRIIRACWWFFGAYSKSYSIYNTIVPSIS